MNSFSFILLFLVFVSRVSRNEQTIQRLSVVKRFKNYCSSIDIFKTQAKQELKNNPIMSQIKKQTPSFYYLNISTLYLDLIFTSAGYGFFIIFWIELLRDNDCDKEKTILFFIIPLFLFIYYKLSDNNEIYLINDFLNTKNFKTLSFRLIKKTLLPVLVFFSGVGLLMFLKEEEQDNLIKYKKTYIDPIIAYLPKLEINANYILFMIILGGISAGLLFIINLYLLIMFRGINTGLAHRGGLPNRSVLPKSRQAGVKIKKRQQLLRLVIFVAVIGSFYLHYINFVASENQKELEEQRQLNFKLSEERKQKELEINNLIEQFKASATPETIKLDQERQYYKSIYYYPYQEINIKINNLKNSEFDNITLAEVNIRQELSNKLQKTWEQILQDLYLNINKNYIFIYRRILLDNKYYFQVNLYNNWPELFEWEYLGIFKKAKISYVLNWINKDFITGLQDNNLFISKVHINTYKYYYQLVENNDKMPGLMHVINQWIRKYNLIYQFDPGKPNITFSEFIKNCNESFSEIQEDQSKEQEIKTKINNFIKNIENQLISQRLTESQVIEISDALQEEYSGLNSEIHQLKIRNLQTYWAKSLENLYLKFNNKMIFLKINNKGIMSCDPFIEKIDFINRIIKKTHTLFLYTCNEMTQYIENNWNLLLLKIINENLWNEAIYIYNVFNNDFFNKESKQLVQLIQKKIKDTIENQDIQDPNFVNDLINYLHDNKERYQEELKNFPAKE